MASCATGTSGLGVLRREIFSQADEKMMERFRDARPCVSTEAENMYELRRFNMFL